MFLKSYLGALSLIGNALAIKNQLKHITMKKISYVFYIAVSIVVFISLCQLSDFLFRSFEDDLMRAVSLIVYSLTIIPSTVIIVSARELIRK